MPMPCGSRPSMAAFINNEVRVARWDSETSMLRIEGPQGWCLSPGAAILSRRGFQPRPGHIEIGLAFILGLRPSRPSEAFFSHCPIIVRS